MPINDSFSGFTPAMGDPISEAVSVTPSDSNDLIYITRALYVGSAGDIRVTLAGGSVVDFAALAVGWHPLRITRIHATGTTAANIIGCW